MRSYKEINKFNYVRFNICQELQEREYTDRKDFIEEHPLFRSWNPRFKRLLEMSLIKEVFSYDSNIIRQGEPVDGLKFLRR